MSTLARARDAFMRVIEETRDLHQRGGDAHTTIELIRYARDLLDIITDESSSTVDDARAALSQLRGRLESLERDVMPTRH